MERAPVKPEYAQLACVLDEALRQAQSGKGADRHTDAPTPFEEQIICRLTRTEGHGFSRGQAIKKIDEAKRLPRQAAIQELLGAINYIAADIVVMREQEASRVASDEAADGK